MFGKSKENPMEKEKDKKKTISKSNKTSVINTNPQLPGVNEQGSAVAKDPVIEKVLDLAQRRKRALAMKKNEPKLERARAMAKTRFAPDIRLKKRAQEMARNIVRRKVAGQRGVEYATLSPSDKINVDKMLDKKVALIKKLADRLMPRIKKSEVERLKQVRTGKKTATPGQAPLMQSVDAALMRKSEKSGIPFEIISEVYKRGHSAWNDTMTHTAEQNAFHRVNSYIAGGKARELDADLIEMKDPCWKGYKMIGTKKKNGKKVPNCVPEEKTIETKPKLKDKTVKREIYTLQVKSMDPMTEQSCDKKPLLSKIKKMVKK